jgi:hypothetical protein
VHANAQGVPAPGAALVRPQAVTAALAWVPRQEDATVACAVLPMVRWLLGATVRLLCWQQVVQVCAVAAAASRRGC